MAFTAVIFTCLIAIIFAAISVATSSQTQPLGFISPNNSTDPSENVLAHQVKNEHNSTFESVIWPIPPKYKKIRWHLQNVRNRNGHPALLGLMDYSTHGVPQEGFVVPAVLKIKKKPNGPIPWIWRKLWVCIG